MADIVDSQTRSRMMAGIRGKDTQPELVLRRALHGHGFRYRLHARDVAGRPDLVLKKYRAIIFVHGCFWHRHENCRLATTPATRPEFWADKFAANVARDRAVQESLLAEGWRVATIWECALCKPHMVDTAAGFVRDWLFSEGSRLDIGEADLE